MLINYVRATGSEMSRIEYNINHHITKAFFIISPQNRYCSYLLANFVKCKSRSLNFSLSLGWNGWGTVIRIPIYFKNDDKLKILSKNNLIISGRIYFENVSNTHWEELTPLTPLGVHPQLFKTIVWNRNEQFLLLWNFRNFCWMIWTKPISLLKLFLLYVF